MVDLPLEQAYKRRLKRDIEERGYDQETTEYRYKNHVEPSYQKFIAPYKSQMHLIVDNTKDLSTGLNKVKQFIKKREDTN